MKSESEKIKAEFEAKILENQQASTDAQSLNAASLQEAILEQKKHAEKMVYLKNYLNILMSEIIL